MHLRRTSSILKVVIYEAIDIASVHIHECAIRTGPYCFYVDLTGLPQRSRSHQDASILQCVVCVVVRFQTFSDL